MSVIVWPPDNGYWPSLTGQAVTRYYSYGELIATYANPANIVPDVEWMEKSSSAGSRPELQHVSWTESSGREVRLFTGGNASRRNQSLFELTANLDYETQLDQRVGDWSVLYWGTAFTSFMSAESPPVGVPPQNICLGGEGSLDDDAELWTLKSDGCTGVITPRVLSAASSPGLSASSQPPSFTGPNPWASKYKLVTTCVSPYPTNTHRLTIGVGEEVNMGLSPQIQPPGDTNLTWMTTAGSLLTWWGNTNRLTAPSNATTLSVTLAYYGKRDEIKYTTSFTVVEPSGIKATLHGQPDQFAIGSVGAGMRMDVVLQPTSVSFYRVQIIEPTAGPTNRTGYFTNTVPPYHDQQHGGGIWHPVAYTNLVVDGVFDHAASGGWAIGQAGSYTWPISPLWGVGAGTASNPLSGWTPQVHTLDADGTMTVNKLGHHVTRQTSELRGTAQ